MDIYDFKNEYDSLSLARRKDFLRRLFGLISENLENESINELVKEILPVLQDAEAEDVFGTEGFQG